MSAARGATIAAAFVLAGCAIVREPPPAPAPPQPAEPLPPSPVVQPIEPKIAPQPPPVVIAAPARPSEIERLVAEFQRLRRLPGPEVVREQEAARHAFNASRSDVARLRYAMTLALPSAPGNDDARALDLLDPLVRNPGSPLQGLAFLIASYVQEQRRLAGQVQGLQQNVQGLQQSLHGLQQKLDALKTLERSLTERGDGATQRRR